MKSLDKKKPNKCEIKYADMVIEDPAFDSRKTKELDWNWQKEFLSSGSMNGCGDLSIMISTVSNILTQQRTELLEKLLIKDPIGGFENSFNNRVKEILK